MAEIAKRRQKYGLLGALEEEEARSYLESRQEEDQKRSWHQRKLIKTVLYETREYVDENSGKRVKETAV